MKEYRRNFYLNNLSNRLNRRLYSILIWARGNRNKADVKEQAAIKAENLFNEYLKQIDGYIYRTKIKGRIGNPEKPDQSFAQERIRQKIDEFKKVLNDVL